MNTNWRNKLYVPNDGARRYLSAHTKLDVQIRSFTEKFARNGIQRFLITMSVLISGENRVHHRKGEEIPVPEMYTFTRVAAENFKKIDCITLRRRELNLNRAQQVGLYT